jgi:two-component system sensor histidine kinase HydH
MQTPRRVVPLARWAVVVAIVLMGAALLLTAWTTHAGVRDASETLVRGEASIFQQEVRTRFLDLGEQAPTVQDLAQILSDRSSEGLRYIAIQETVPGSLEPARVPALQVGSSDAATAEGAPITPAFATLAPDRPQRAGSRVRVLFKAGQRLPGPPTAPAPGLPEVSKRRLYHVAIEFEPRQAQALLAAAASTLTIGALAASTLLLIAAALVRWVVRRERSLVAMERARRLASLGELSAVLAHEIRNPLASLKGNAQLLAQGLPAGEKPRQKADRVVDEAIRLENLTNDLLEFVRSGEIERRDTDPAALLSSSVQSLALAGGAPPIEVDAGAAPDAWSLDSSRMTQVLTNLLENAVQAGAPVRAKVAAEGGSLVFEVRDSGPGVPEDEKERIFEPFYTKRTRGTGLGLAVAKRVVELHRGTISVANAPGGGAVFRVAVPRG